jgi:sugar lactone lactonase YvrE
LEPARGDRIVSSKAGFTTVVAVDFGPDGLLYVLELSDQAGFPTPGFGKVVRVKRSGEIEEIVTGLSVPTGMIFGPDGRLYVSNLGAAPAGAGQILRFDISLGW